MHERVKQTIPPPHTPKITLTFFLASLYMLRSSEHRVLLTRASRRLVWKFVFCPDKFMCVSLWISVYRSVFLLLSLKGYTIVRGEIVSLKAKITEEAFVPEGDEKGGELFFSYTDTDTQTHTHPPSLSPLRQREGEHGLQVVDNIKGVLFLGHKGSRELRLHPFSQMSLYRHEI